MEAPGLSPRNESVPVKKAEKCRKVHHKTMEVLEIKSNEILFSYIPDSSCCSLTLRTTIWDLVIRDSSQSMLHS